MTDWLDAGRDMRLLDPRVRRNGIELSKRAHVVFGHDSAIVEAEKRVRVYTARRGRFAGHLRCSQCKKEHTERRPCKHIVAVLLALGFIVPDEEGP